MSGHRTLKRVPLDFKWRLNKVWKGYINPFPEPPECSICQGSGHNAATNQIGKDFYDQDGDGSRRWCDEITQDEVQALLDADLLWDFTRIPLNNKQVKDVREKMAKGGNSWLPYDNGKIPTAAEVNAWNKGPGFGHDCQNCLILIEARAKRLGVLGKCPTCKGNGTIPHRNKKTKRKWKAWKAVEPPVGEGYQLWETCSEGSPMSPVFATPELLADWCASNATIFSSEKTSRENWLQMFTGRKDIEKESLLIHNPLSGYVGSAANEPHHRHQ